MFNLLLQKIKYMKNITHLLYDNLIALGWSQNLAIWCNMFALLTGLVVLVIVVNYSTKALLIEAFTRFSVKSKTQLDDLLVKHKVPRNLAYIFPMILALEFNNYVLLTF